MMTILSVVFVLQHVMLDVQIPINGNLEACAAIARGRVEQMLATDFQGARVERFRCEERS